MLTLTSASFELASLNGQNTRSTPPKICICDATTEAESIDSIPLIPLGHCHSPPVTQCCLSLRPGVSNISELSKHDGMKCTTMLPVSSTEGGREVVIGHYKVP